MVLTTVAVLYLTFAAVPIESPGVRCVLVVPPDEEPWPDSQQRLDLVLKDAQWWYSCQMEAHGYGAKTFSLETDAEGRVVVHVARLKDPPPTTDANGLRLAVIQEAEKIVGDPRKRRGTIMVLVYNGYYWSDRAKFHMTPMGFGAGGRWAHFTAWHYFSVNPNAWMVKTPVPDLPENNPYFPPLHTKVIQAFSGDGVKSVAQRSSVGHGVFLHEMGHAFGLPHPPKEAPRVPGDIMAAGMWAARGNFVGSLRNEFACLTAANAAALNKNPLFQVRDVGPPSSKAARSIGARGAIRSRD